MTRQRNARYFFRGLGRAMDLRGAIGGRYLPPRRWIRSDGAAMASDWAAVFGDLGAAYERVKECREYDG